MYAMKGRLAAEDVWPAVFSCAVIAFLGALGEVMSDSERDLRET